MTALHSAAVSTGPIFPCWVNTCEGNTIDVVFVNSYLSDKVTVMQKSFGFTDHDLLLLRIDLPNLRIKNGQDKI